MTKPNDIVWVVICCADGEDDVRHIFSTKANAEAFMETDGRVHVLYDYALDCPERHEGAPQ